MSKGKHLIKFLSVWFIQRIPKWFPFHFFHYTRNTKWWNCSTHWWLYSPALIADSISRKDYRIVISLFLPMFFFNLLYLEMARVTIVALKTDMWSPLVTVHALFVLRTTTTTPPKPLLRWRALSEPLLSLSFLRILLLEAQLRLVCIPHLTFFSTLVIIHASSI